MCRHVPYWTRAEVEFKCLKYEGTCESEAHNARISTSPSASSKSQEKIGQSTHIQRELSAVVGFLYYIPVK